MHASYIEGIAFTPVAVFSPAPSCSLQFPELLQSGFALVLTGVSHLWLSLRRVGGAVAATELAIHCGHAEISQTQD